MTRRRIASRLAWLGTLGTLSLALNQAASAAPLCPEPAPDPTPAVAAPLHAEGRYFKDAAGRVVLLRGVNVAGNAKVPPFQAITQASMLDPLPGWGINTIRLLFTWEAFEPTRCVYDDNYLRHYEQVVRWAAERQLYVIVDFHQDGYSRYSIDGCGEGFPQWAVSSKVTQYAPDNGPNCAGWTLKTVLDASHHKTWREFHRDSEGAKTRYVAMAGAVAQRLSQYPNVVGYDLINEPWGSDAELLSLFEQVGQAIRAHHPSSILFVPAHALQSLGSGPDGIEQPSFSNTAYSPHYYDTTLALTGSWLNTSPQRPLDARLAKANSRRDPMLLGEFGSKASNKNVQAYLEQVYTWLDLRFVSATQWNYTPGWTPQAKDGWNDEDLSIVDDRGQLRPALFQPRAYPQKTAGLPIAFKRQAPGWSYTWLHDPQLGATEIYLPADDADGRTLRSSPAGIECELQPQGVVCSGPSAGLATVTLSP